MEINGKVHCFFEQSGTFKNEFIKLGIPAEDYDIQNNFGETDHVMDLFAEISAGYTGEPSVFNTISEDDLIVAFFPCIEFSCVAQMWYSLGAKDYAKWPYIERIKYMVNKNQKRAKMYELLMKFFGICLDNGYRMILENPWSEQTYLKQNVFLMKPSFIDKNRTLRGDYVRKPTAYWFVNCEPTNGKTYQPTAQKNVRRIQQMRKNPVAGMCSEERSMISPDYARNFICDKIIGKAQQFTQLTINF